MAPNPASSFLGELVEEAASSAAERVLGNGTGEFPDQEAFRLVVLRHPRFFEVEPGQWT